MTLKIKFLAAAAALTLPALAAAQQPAPPAPSSTTIPPTRQPADASGTEAQQAAQTPPPATTPTAAAPVPPAPAAQAQATPSTPPAAAAGPVSAATAADLRAGIQVRDQQGGLVGTVESADVSGAVIFTGTARGRLAVTSFGRNSRGLVIAMTRAQLEAAIAAATPSAARAPAATPQS